MIITRAQVQVLEEHAEAGFVRRMAHHLRAKHEDVTVTLPEGESTLGELPDATLEQLVHAALARARTRGLTVPAEIRAFIAVMFVVAPNFDEHPLVRRLLSEPGWTPEERLDRVLELASDANWEGARRRYDAGAWQTVQ